MNLHENRYCKARKETELTETLSSELDSILDNSHKNEEIQQTKTHITENSVAVTLSYIGWIVLTIGIIVGIVLGLSLKIRTLIPIL
jgi:hypothetical protein